MLRGRRAAFAKRSRLSEAKFKNRREVEERPFISVICPVYNEEAFVGNFIQSILGQDYPRDREEVFLVDGRSTDRTREIIQSYVKEYPFLRLLDNPEKTVPYALNKGIRQSKGDIIIRLDAHCRYPSDYFPVLVKYQQSLDAENVGAVWNTLPAKDTALCHAIAIASSHPFGVGNSLSKTGVSQLMEVDTVPFGCFPRRVFDKLGLFDEELVRNQDDEFNGRITQSGGKIYLVPDLVIDYYARRDLRRMFKMYYQYGLFKPLVNTKLKKPTSLRQFVPGLFVAGLLLGALVSVFFPVLWWIYGIVVTLYLLSGLTIGIRQAVKRKKAGIALWMPVVFFVVHLAYGLGYWAGIWKVLARRPFVVDVSR